MATAFNPDFGPEGVADFALNDTDIFASGCYHALDGTLRPGLVSFSLATGVLNPWTPILGGGPEGTIHRKRCHCFGGYDAVIKVSQRGD